MSNISETKNAGVRSGNKPKVSPITIIYRRNNSEARELLDSLSLQELEQLMHLAGCFIPKGVH